MMLRIAMRIVRQAIVDGIIDPYAVKRLALCDLPHPERPDYTGCRKNYGHLGAHEWQCPAQHFGFCCSKNRGHEGEHVTGFAERTPFSKLPPEEQMRAECERLGGR